MQLASQFMRWLGLYSFAPSSIISICHPCISFLQILLFLVKNLRLIFAYDLLIVRS